VIPKIRKPDTCIAAFSQTLQLPTLQEHLESDRGFLSAYARAITAIALDDGDLTLLEFSALNAVASLSGDTALFQMSLLHAVDGDLDLADCLGALRDAAEGVDVTTREAALRLAYPVLARQAAEARPLTARLAKALGLRTSTLDLASLPERRRLTCWAASRRRCADS